MRVLVACEYSNVVADAFRKKGHSVLTCDLLENEVTGNQFHYQGDVRDVLYNDWDLVVAHPPCTALCVTGNRHYAGTDAREKGLAFFKLFLDLPGPTCVENPVGVVSSRIRPPTQYIQPYQFGHRVSKRTGLWLTNGLVPLVPTNVVDVDEPVIFPSGKRMSKWFYETSLLPPKERGHVRSRTFQGIADAMAEQWG